MWPPHFRAFVEQHRLAGAETEIPVSDDLSGLGALIGLYDEAAAREEAFEFYLGLVVKEDGFVPIGQDLTGSGDPYFINTRDDSPGPVYRIYHDSMADRSYNSVDAIVTVLESYEKLLNYVGT
ncbi:MAG: hypothetical protein JWP89_211 [Schlesneria sp.]|nr:hypothetical protein [Schlesneria sp.]